MSSAPTPTQLAERVEIHKSCKALETLLNILNDYCEAAGAVVLLQKKLVKALREVASMKATGSIPANALSSSATVFETLSDIDTKFAKIVDKEYDNISAEVKKWFKKLAKEEKAHDDWISTSNARIKQAGLAYEKKSKKNPRDAEEEHARYINLLSSLGPEINHEKYNHALQVTHRHTLTTYSVAACLSRVADAEWLRVCEGIKRVSPAMGQLGEWKALCEGLWTGPIPQGLPDVDQPQVDVPTQHALSNDETERHHLDLNAEPVGRADARSTTTGASRSPIPMDDGQKDLSSTQNSRTGANGTVRSMYTSSASSSVPPSSFDPPRLLTEPNTGSVRSLSAFPAPPTHFPIPPLRRPSVTQRTDSLNQSPTEPTIQDQSRAPSSTTSNISFPSAPRMTESPIPDEGLELELPQGGEPDNMSTSTRSLPPPAPSESQPPEHALPPDDAPGAGRHPPPPQYPHGQLTTETRPRGSTPLDQTAADTMLTEEDTTGRRGLARKSSNPRPVDVARVRPLDRADTGTGSIVAAMKGRISSGSGASGPGRSTSPPPKDIPPLPLSVANLASRYEPSEGPASPVQLRANSPPVSRRLSSPLDTATQARLAEFAFREVNLPHNTRAPGASSMTPMPEDAATNRGQRPNSAASTQAALLEKERLLQLREREIELKARELALDRARLLGDGVSNSPRISKGEPSSPRLTPRDRHASFESHTDGSTRTHQPMPRPQYSYSTTHLVPPSSPYSSHSQKQSSSTYSQSTSQPPSPQSLHSPSDHAPYCGCDKCSIAKYKTSPKIPSADLRPPEKPFTLRPEKSKGWMRRLSMPVGNPFSLDHKRNNSAAGTFSLDGRKNGSSTAMREIQEDGRKAGGRIKYEVGGGISNRSVVSLALGGHDQR